MSDLYEDGLSLASRDALREARAKMAEFSQIDHRAGHAAPEDCSLDSHLRTALSALFAGLARRDWDCVAEGVVMVQDCEWRAMNQRMAHSPQ